MTKKEILKIFEEKNVRTVWDDKEEKWYFSIVDVVEVLTNSADPKQYIKKMRKRDPQLDANWGTICTLVQMKGADGKSRKQMAADTEGMFRLIQAIPSPKAEPFKVWMAQVASSRIDQMQESNLSRSSAIRSSQVPRPTTICHQQRMLRLKSCRKSDEELCSWTIPEISICLQAAMLSLCALSALARDIRDPESHKFVSHKLV